MTENHFGPEVAARYDETSASMFAPDVLDPPSTGSRSSPPADRRYPIPFRYVWPSELDLMARLAGLRLRHRWGDWHGARFTADSRSHVSVWEKPAG